MVPNSEVSLTVKFINISAKEGMFFSRRFSVCLSASPYVSRITQKLMNSDKTFGELRCVIAINGSILVVIQRTLGLCYC